MTIRIFDRDTYEKVYQPGLVRLRDSLREWNEKSNALYPPYEDEVEWLTNMIRVGQERLDRGGGLDP